MSESDYTRAAQVAFEREAADVAGAMAGGRSSRLRKAAYAMGQLLHVGAFTESEAEAELLRASEANGHVADDGQAAILKTIRKGLAAGKANPRQAQGRGHACREHTQGGKPSLPTQPVKRDAPEMSLPSDKWLVRARAWFDSLNTLPDSDRALAERALLERGLDPRRAYTEYGIRWNYNPSHWESLAVWGVAPYTSESGRHVTDLMLARGLVIGASWNGYLVGLEIRREASEVPRYGKYCQVAGSAKPMAYCVGANGLPVILCESALDAALVYQETGGAYQCIASMGNAKTLAKPYVALVQQAPEIYYIPDNDAGGEDGAAKILADFPRATVVTLPAKVKDVGDLAKRHFYGEAGFLPTVKQWLASVGLIPGDSNQASADPREATSDGDTEAASSPYPADTSADTQTLTDTDTPPAWNGDYVDGNPCCMWPEYLKRIMRERGLEKYSVDLKGYGIPSHGLPQDLQGLAKTGWRVVEGENGHLTLERTTNVASNEYGNRAYLHLREQAIRQAIAQWKRYCDYYGVTYPKR